MIAKKRKIGVVVLSIVAFCVCAIVFLAYQQPEKPFQIAIQYKEELEIINPWEDEEGNYYVFLPGCVKMEDVKIIGVTDEVIKLNDVRIFDGMLCATFALDVPYDIEYTMFGVKQKRQLSFLQASYVSSMFIDTESGGMEYIHADKNNQESGTLRLYESDGILNCEVDRLKIKGRGNATWIEPEKKPYTIEFDCEENLLNMGKAKKWVLLANSADYSHLRNKIVYDFAGQMGQAYSPESRWVDLYLNGVYAGLYLLSEKNEVHSNRIDIASDESFLMSLDVRDRLKQQNLPYIETELLQALRIHYPENLQKEQLTRIQNQWQSVENAIVSEQGFDLVSKKYFWEMADLDSWVQSYLIDEIFGNLDGFKASRYFYFDGNSEQKIYAGPVWDYDKAMGNDTDVYWSITNPDVQVLHRYAYDPQSAHLWAQELYEKSWFREALKSKFENEILPAVEELIDTKSEHYVQMVRRSALMDSVRWGYDEIESFDQAVAKLEKYLKDHIQYLKKVWINGEQYCQISLLKIGCDQFYAVPYGGQLQELPEMADRGTQRFAGWYYLSTDEPFDIAKPITEDIQIYAKWEETMTKDISQLMKLVPMSVIAVIGVGLAYVAVKRMRSR